MSKNPFRIIWVPNGKILKHPDADSGDVVFINGPTLKFKSAPDAFYYIDKSKRFEENEKDLCIVIKIIDRDEEPEEVA